MKRKIITTDPDDQDKEFISTVTGTMNYEMGITCTWDYSIWRHA